MKKHISLFLIFLSGYVHACQCPVLPALSKESCEAYDVIFYGKVDSVSSCDTKGIAIAYFTVSELFKGNIEQQVSINFDCSSECMMSFSTGEEWLIYSKYVKFDLLKVEICEHSRRKFSDDAQDIYMMAAKRTIEKEREFLKTTFGLQNFKQPNDLNKMHDETGPRNTQPSSWGKLILLLISVVVMGGVYFFTRKKK